MCYNRWSGEAEWSITPSGGYGELGTVEQVEPGSAVLDEGGLAVAGVCRTYDKEWEKVQVEESVKGVGN
jgi:hypothetical protein